MSELLLPSGYEASRSLEHPLTVDQNVLPWLKEPYNLNITECTLSSGESFYLASALGSSPRLVKAAEGMTDKQRRNNEGGQRVYFGRTDYTPEGEDSLKPFILRLGVCDKNKQGIIFSVLGNKSDRQSRRSTSK